MSEPDHHAQKAQAHWDAWQRDHDARSQQKETVHYTDWAGHPLIWNKLCEAAFGSASTDVFDYVFQQYPELAIANGLSLCCGDGSVERDLIRRGLIHKLCGLDLSAARIAAAKAALCLDLPSVNERCHFVQADLNRVPFAAGKFDLVLAKSALHHLEALEAVCEHLANLLRPRGLFVALDFFGPSRFQWTDQQLSLANAFWDKEAPAECRFNKDGALDAPISRPSLDAMIEMDPSEAIRSGEILAVMNAHFCIERYIPMGGTLLNLIFWGERINRFSPARATHASFIAKAFDYERALLGKGIIPSDFALVIARPIT